MQEVTDGAFWTLVHRYGGADVYWTEYFRVQAESTPERRILEAISRNTTGRPVVAQMIGNDIPALVRTARVLQQYPVAAIDLNLGCPAPIVYRKCAGGGLLREPERIDAILGALARGGADPVHGQDPRRLRVHGGVRPAAADLRAARARRADRARPHRRAALPDAGALRPHPSGRGGDAVSGHRQRARAFGRRRPRTCCRAPAPAG